MESLGFDEVGRGCLAGPVGVGCAWVSKEHVKNETVRDSKKLSHKKREDIVKYYFSNSTYTNTPATHYWQCNTVASSDFFLSFCTVDNKNIDEFGIVPCIKEGCGKLLKRFNAYRDRLNIHSEIQLLFDGPYPLCENTTYEYRCIIDGDAKKYSIALAAIYAKVHRDSLFTCNASEGYTNYIEKYDWANNKGYGTKKHIAGIKQHGLSEYHRKTFCFNITDGDNFYWKKE